MTENKAFEKYLGFSFKCESEDAKARLKNWIDSLGENPTELCDVSEENIENWCADFNFDGVQTLVLPTTIKKIGKCVFAQSQLENLIADGVESLDELAFYNTKKLQSVLLPNCTSLSADCFNHSHIKALSLPKVCSVGRYCFYDMPNITKIDLPSLTSIEPYAIYGNACLQAVGLGHLEHADFAIVTMNPNLERISAKELLTRDTLAFHSNSTDCELQTAADTKITSVAVKPRTHNHSAVSMSLQPENFEYKYSYNGFKFNLVKSLSSEQEKIVENAIKRELDKCKGFVPQGENAEENESAADCFKFLKDIFVPAEIKSIGDYAFSKCYSLESFVGLGVEEIGDHAFYCDEILRYVEVPNCTKLKDDAFNGAGCSCADDVVTKIIALNVESVGKHAFWQTGFVCLNMPKCTHISTTAIEENERLQALCVASFDCKNAAAANPVLSQVNSLCKNLPVQQAVYASPAVVIENVKL
jgi:hypothetical protein